MDILRGILYSAIVLAATLYFVFGYSPWSDDVVDASDISWDTEIEGKLTVWDYDPDKTVFVYNNEFANLLQMETEQSTELPEPLFAIRAYVFPTPQGGSINKLQFYIDSDVNMHLPNNIATTRAYEKTYLGFLGFEKDSSKESAEIKNRIDKFFVQNQAIFASQVIVQNTEGNAKSVAIDRYTKELIPRMTLLDTGTELNKIDRVYLYMGKEAPSAAYTNKVIEALSNGEPLSEQAKKDFLKIELPKTIRGFLNSHCHTESSC